MAGHPQRLGWIPQEPQPRSSCHDQKPKDAPARWRLGRASSTGMAPAPCALPCGTGQGGTGTTQGRPALLPRMPELRAAPGDEWAPAGSPSSATSSDFDSNPSPETKPALHSQHPPPPSRGSYTRGAPCGWPKGSGGRAACSSRWQSRFPCLSRARYLEPSELAAPASTRAA